MLLKRSPNKVPQQCSLGELTALQDYSDDIWVETSAKCKVALVFAFIKCAQTLLYFHIPCNKQESSLKATSLLECEGIIYGREKKKKKLCSYLWVFFENMVNYEN